ncbi:hypothetical protein P280DRAFT_255975 [Massarina eburnea CBS 473.64]|uniref:Reverse transcriptase domain-containing protein n=1 Tax=Massarina eburnea CBS 473.64 TaxID=1395130 RepID=A0A6A6SAX4_9PLEO|nr:hypothetical protein P280DRAFT_255975 [Massarina eburnea CBS 473.64]
MYYARFGMVEVGPIGSWQTGNPLSMLLCAWIMQHNQYMLPGPKAIAIEDPREGKRRAGPDAGGMLCACLPAHRSLRATSGEVGLGGDTGTRNGIYAELNHAKALFRERYNLDGDIIDVAPESDAVKRLSGLLNRIKELDPYLQRDSDLLTLTRLVEQAQNDRSISTAKLARLEKDLKERLEKHTHRLDVSALHVELLQEVLDADRNVNEVEKKMGNVVLEDEFELVEDELESVFEKFEKNTFSTKDVDEEAIERYLNSLFDNEAAKDQLKEIRSALDEYGSDIISSCEEDDDEIVAWCITDLLKNETLSEEKRKTLQGYLQSPLAIKELKSVLNMKSVRHWNFRNTAAGLPVTARQNAEGKYTITIEEDIIDMLFLHSLAIGWSMKLKGVIKDAVSYKGVWPGNKLLSVEELEKREYWLLPTRYKPFGLPHASPPQPMMPPAPMSPIGYSASIEAAMGRRLSPMGPPPPMPPQHHCARSSGPKPRKAVSRGGVHRARRNGPQMPGTPNLNDERYRDYTRSFLLARLPVQVGCVPERVDEKETQALLLKTLATEAKLRLALDDNVGDVSAKFDAFTEALPHKTILTVLKFIGVPKQWLDVFTRFLGAPLNMGPVVRGTDDQILPRTCGVPAGHGLEAFFSEAMLFFLDLAVHKKTRAYLYRLRDKCYFVGKEEQVDTVTEEISHFAHVMGLEVITGPISNESIGFINLTAHTDVVTHGLSTTKIEAHARRIKKQLASCTTVIEWIRTWNATMGTYSPHLFGPLANVFGKAHLDAVTQAYNLMHQIIFDGDNLTSHVKNLLNTHFDGLTDPPFALEALIHLPHAYGGLGIKNPYIALNLAHNLAEDTYAPLNTFKDSEEKYYERAKAKFARMTPTAINEKRFNIFNNDMPRQESVLGASTDTTVFPSLATITENRERAAYAHLPPPSYPEPTTVLPLPNLLDAYENLMYGDEAFERYGGLECWHGDSVPKEVLRLVRGEEEDVVFEEYSSSVSSEC